MAFAAASANLQRPALDLAPGAYGVIPIVKTIPIKRTPGSLGKIPEKSNHGLSPKKVVEVLKNCY